MAEIGERPRSDLVDHQDGAAKARVASTPSDPLPQSTSASTHPVAVPSFFLPRLSLTLFLFHPAVLSYTCLTSTCH